MESQKQVKKLFKSVRSAVGVVIVSLLIGLVLDYGITQLLSQYVLSDCSEDCYFRYFNLIFMVFAALSLVAGFISGYRAFTNLSDEE